MARLDEFGMNAKQRKFADRYLLNGNNAAEAYRYAYNPKADDKTATATGFKVRIRSAVNAYIEKRQEEFRAIAEAKQLMTAEELIKLLTEYLRGERDDVDFTVDVETDGVMGRTSTTKTKRVGKQWAAEMLMKLLGADKTGGKDKFQVLRILVKRKI